MNKKFTPQVGQTYQNTNGYFYLCLDSTEASPFRATMQQPKSLWTFVAVNCRLYEDSRINWDYSVNGFFAKVEEV